MGQLVGAANRLTGVAFEPSEVFPSEALDHLRVQCRDAFGIGRATPQPFWQRARQIAYQSELAVPVNLRMAGEYLLDQGGSRAHHPDNKHWPPRLAA